MNEIGDNSESRINPRSTGVINDLVYEKTTTEISLKAEALELARCQKEQVFTEHIFTPNMLSFDEEKNKIVTKRIHGKELYLTIWNPTNLLGRLRGKKIENMDLVLSRIVELGEWLAKYHRSSAGSEQKTESLNWLRLAFNEKLSYIKEHKLLSARFANKIERKYLNLLEETQAPTYLAENQITICKTHGDFIIYNILIDVDYNLHVMDFGESKTSGDIEDVARFYSNIWAISQTNKTRRKLFLPLADKFIESYGLDKSICNTNYFKCNMAYNFLAHLGGQHYMKHLLSPISYFELNQITRVGINWVRKNFV